MATLTFISESIDDYNYGEWLSSSLKFQRLLLKHAAGSVNGTIKIIDFTGPINKACFQLGAAIRLILIMEKSLFLHCSPFALFSPGASHILWIGFHVGLDVLLDIKSEGQQSRCKGDRERHRRCSLSNLISALTKQMAFYQYYSNTFYFHNSNTMNFKVLSKRKLSTCNNNIIFQGEQPPKTGLIRLNVYKKHLSQPLPAMFTSHLRREISTITEMKTALCEHGGVRNVKVLFGEDTNTLKKVSLLLPHWYRHSGWVGCEAHLTQALFSLRYPAKK